jgi:hypothetical protein
MVVQDPEAFLRAMMAPLSRARRGGPLPGVPFSREAVANAFVMLGLLPGARAEEILAGYRQELEAKGFRLGVLTGELSVVPGALGYHEARAASRADLTGIPLAVAAGPVPLAFSGTELVLTSATLTPDGVKLGLRAVIPDTGWSPRRPISGRPALQLAEEIRFELPGQRFAAEVRAGLAVTDDLGRMYRLRPVTWGDAPGEPGRRRWRGEVLAKPQPGGTATGGAVRWLEFAGAESQPVRVDMPAPAAAETGPAELAWPTPAEAYLAELASARSMTIATGEDSVELDVAKIVAAVADALLWTGALPADSALLSGREAPTPGWQEELAELWGRQAQLRARDGEPERAGLAVWMPLHRATAVIESIAAHGDLVSIELYGHPWLSGEYWPMIVPSFQVRATDDAGAEHRGMRGDGGGRPEGCHTFWFWPPMPPVAQRIRVTVSTLWEAAWAELAIPGRSR